MREPAPEKQETHDWDVVVPEDLVRHAGIANRDRRRIRRGEAADTDVEKAAYDQPERGKPDQHNDSHCAPNDRGSGASDDSGYIVNLLAGRIVEEGAPVLSAGNPGSRPAHQIVPGRRRRPLPPILAHQPGELIDGVERLEFARARVGQRCAGRVHCLLQSPQHARAPSRPRQPASPPPAAIHGRRSRCQPPAEPPRRFDEVPGMPVVHEADVMGVLPAARVALEHLYEAQPPDLFVRSLGRSLRQNMAPIGKPH